MSEHYALEARNYSEHGYIGFYKDKSIRAIGKLKKTILAIEVNGNIDYQTESGEPVTQDEMNRE